MAVSASVSNVAFQPAFSSTATASPAPAPSPTDTVSSSNQPTTNATGPTGVTYSAVASVNASTIRGTSVNIVT